MTGVCSPIFSVWLLLCLRVCPCRGITITGFSGQKVTLPCNYDFKYHGKCEICWMRGDIPTFGCGNEIIASDGDEVVRKTSQRYQLDGELQKGDASLTIHNTTVEDSGRYGCRVEVPGLFNDEKITIDLNILNVTSTSTGHFSITSSPSSPLSENNKIEKESTDDTLPVTVAVTVGSVLLILLASVPAVYLIWKKKKRTSESSEIDQDSNPSAIYMNSDFSLGLKNRSMAVENVSKVDNEKEYEQWSRDQDSNHSAIYNNSDFSFRLNNRSMVAENVSETDTEN